jgi:hypothetical protein
MFDDVYAEKPAHLLQQEKDTLDHIAKYPDYYHSSGNKH